MRKFDEDDYEKLKEGEMLNNEDENKEENCECDDDDDDEIDCIAEKFLCMSLYNRDSLKPGRSWEKYGEWRQEQKSRAARLEKQLKARWEIEKLIDEQLNSFHAHYNQAMVPTVMKDIPQLLTPKWAPAHELVAVSWLGDWRPSAILELALGLARRSSSSSSSSSASPSSLYFSDSPGAEQLLIEFIREIRIEEAILDEEMAEIQATCILHLPFGPMNIKPSEDALACLQSVFKTIERVITKAQQLRFKALEIVLKKVLSLTDAAEFLVVFEDIQDSIHKFAVKQRPRKSSVTVPVKTLGSPGLPYNQNL